MGDGESIRRQSLAEACRSRIFPTRTRNCLVFGMLSHVNTRAEEVKDTHTVEKIPASKV